MSSSDEAWALKVPTSIPTVCVWGVGVTSREYLILRTMYKQLREQDKCSLCGKVKQEMLLGIGLGEGMLKATGMDGAVERKARVGPGSI